VNPYRGCEIGCHYCYAVYTHRYLGIDDPSQFDSLVFSKENAKDLLRRELAKGVSGAIAVGTGTDPYQPAERRFETTRGILEAFAEFSGNAIGITTKSDLILRDIDLLGKIAMGNQLHVSITVTTMDDALSRALEPRSVRPDRRTEAVRELRWRGIEAGIFTTPVLPLLTDSSELLEEVAKAAKRVDASYWHAHPLFLKSAARERMVSFLDEQFPHLTARYKAHYCKGAYVSPGYRDWLSAKICRIRERHGLAGQVLARGRKPVVSELAPLPLQGNLFHGVAA
jgi:DNA repair photolyase